MIARGVGGVFQSTGAHFRPPYNNAYTLTSKFSACEWVMPHPDNDKDDGHVGGVEVESALEEVPPAQLPFKSISIRK